MREIKPQNLSYIFLEIKVYEKVNAEKYVWELYEMLGCGVEDYKKGIGSPDLQIREEGEVYYVEVKTNGDGLRPNQFKWIKDNPDKRVVVFFLNQITEKEAHRKILDDREKAKEIYERKRELTDELRKII